MPNKNFSIASFTGILEVDSPSAKSIILRCLGSMALEKLSITYREVASSSSLLDENLDRKPLVRYNPRPARLIHILLTEAKCHVLEIIEAAVLATKDKRSSSIQYLSTLKPQTFQKYPQLSALVLDELRHLHMSREKDNPEVKNYISALAELSSHSAFDHWPRIGKLIFSALQRAQSNTEKFARHQRIMLLK